NSPGELARDEAMSTRPAAREAMTTMATIQSCQRRRSTASSEGVEKSRRPTTFASRANSWRLDGMSTYRLPWRGCLDLRAYQERSVDFVDARVHVEVDDVLAGLAGGDASDADGHGRAAQ